MDKSLIHELNKIDDEIERLKEEANELVKSHFPIGQIFQKGKSEYRVIGHAYAHSGPFDVRVENLKSGAKPWINVKFYAHDITLIN